VDVVAKLRAVLPKDLRPLVDEVSLLAGPARERPPDGVDLALVRRAVREQRKARIDYAGPQGAPSTRTIWPLGLAYFERARVVIAWCESRNDFRTFRTDRITSWAPLPERIGRPRTTLLREWRAREAIPEPTPG
jgi:predicted DNA-binding transcriptional regulator YafY